MEFKGISHETYVYRRTWGYAYVIVCRRVDEFDIPANQNMTSDYLPHDISQKVNTFTEYGITKRLNGMDIYHSQIYVKKTVSPIFRHFYGDIVGMIKERANKT